MSWLPGNVSCAFERISFLSEINSAWVWVCAREDCLRSDFCEGRRGAVGSGIWRIDAECREKRFSESARVVLLVRRKRVFRQPIWMLMSKRIVMFSVVRVDPN